MFKIWTLPWIEFGIARQIEARVVFVLRFEAPVPSTVGKAAADVTVTRTECTEMQTKCTTGNVDAFDLFWLANFWFGLKCIVVQFIIIELVQVGEQIESRWHRIFGGRRLDFVVQSAKWERR